MKMLRGIILLLTGVSSVCGNACNMPRSNCTDYLTEIGGYFFPMLGQDANAFDNFCRQMNTTIPCISSYAETCENIPNCTYCNPNFEYLKKFYSKVEWKNFIKEICNEKSSLRQSYLENINCMRGYQEEYGSCYNHAVTKVKFFHLPEERNISKNTCCKYSPHHQCMLNVTKQNCADATGFMTAALLLYRGHYNLFYLCSHNLKEEDCGENTTQLVSDALMLIDGESNDVCFKAATICDPYIPPPVKDEKDAQKPLVNTSHSVENERNEDLPAEDERDEDVPAEDERDEDVPAEDERDEEVHAVDEKDEEVAVVHEKDEEIPAVLSNGTNIHRRTISITTVSYILVILAILYYVITFIYHINKF